MPSLESSVIFEARAKLASIVNSVTHEDLTGFVFASSGAEANECAIRLARRFTGKEKVLSRHRSYHGGTAFSLGASGDFRTNFNRAIPGFVKFMDFQAQSFKWGQTHEEAVQNYLNYLEELIIYENPATIACITIELIVGSNGVLWSPTEVN